jgi:hypothetical protein
MKILSRFIVVALIASCLSCAIPSSSLTRGSWLDIIEHARWAQNAHNMQSWKLTVSPGDPNTLWIWLDSRRLLPQTDPPSRQLLISVGCFLAAAEDTAAARGLKLSWTLFPNGSWDPTRPAEAPVASLSKTPDPQVPPGQKLDALSTATVKYRVTPLVFSKDFFDSQENHYSREGIRFTWILEPSRLEKIKKIVRDAYAVEMTLPRTLDESYLNTRFNGYQRRVKPWGITLLPNFPVWAIPLVDIWETLFPESRQDYAKSSMELFSSAVESSKAILVVATQGNTPALQVRTGVPLQRLWMEVLSAGGSLLPLSQALQEYPEMEELRSAIHREASQPGETIQMLLSLGKPKGTFFRSPRISATDLLTQK